MLENYFYDKSGIDQDEKIKREKAVAAVLEIIKTSSGHVPMHVSITTIINDVDQAANAIQAALDK
ncbi:hypothetical protein BZ160_04615 [Pantoea vagans]|nr:hypothetical protein [Pantoea vagans]OQV43407.1 hypothetical protein BZ160_04615 [Pantoea vagans]